VADSDGPDTVIADGPLGVAVIPAGKPEKLKLIVPVNPLTGFAWIAWSCSAPPCCVVTAWASTEREKSAAGGGGGGGVEELPDPPPQEESSSAIMVTIALVSRRMLMAIP
jgi:hypothetical protein